MICSPQKSPNKDNFTRKIASNIISVIEILSNPKRGEPLTKVAQVEVNLSHASHGKLSNCVLQLCRLLTAEPSEGSLFKYIFLDCNSLLQNQNQRPESGHVQREVGTHTEFLEAQL